MPKGLKSTSSIIQISGEITESGIDTFTSDKIDLQLNPLDNEVFVVLAVNLDVSAPDSVTDRVTGTNMTLSATERQTVGSLANSNVMAHKRVQITNVGDTSAVLDEHIAGETPSSLLDYVYILATNDFYANIEGSNNTAAKKGIFRVYGYRARADAATYAALVQSEVLSS